MTPCHYSDTTHFGDTVLQIPLQALMRPSVRVFVTPIQMCYNGTQGVLKLTKRPKNKLSTGY